jgi:hypothetical protein
MGHSELDFDRSMVHNASSKLPYDIKLQALETRKKKLQSFVGAIAELLAVDHLLAQDNCGD